MIIDEETRKLAQLGRHQGYFNINNPPLTKFDLQAGLMPGGVQINYENINPD